MNIKFKNINLCSALKILNYEPDIAKGEYN